MVAGGQWIPSTCGDRPELAGAASMRAPSACTLGGLILALAVGGFAIAGEPSPATNPE